MGAKDMDTADREMETGMEWGMEGDSVPPEWDEGMAPGTVLTFRSFL